jgi:hypothetical protein
VAAGLFLPARALATAGDFLPAGLQYKATTYSGHSNYFPGGGDDLNSVDVPTYNSQPIYAPEGGSVAQVSWDAGNHTGGGNAIVWTSADGRERIYVGHLSAVVKTGQVNGGDHIANAGHTGYCDPPTFEHLHLNRTYNGVVTRVVLSGQTITPGSIAAPKYYVSAGQTGTPPPAASNRIGMVDSYGKLRVKEGDLNASWVDEAGAISAFQLEGNRIAALQGKTLWVKEGLNGTWVNEYTDTIAFAMSGSSQSPAVAKRTDTTPPTTTVTGADDAWHSTSVTLTFLAADNAGGSGLSGGSAKTEYQIDAGNWTTGTSVTVAAPTNHGNDGEHTVSYRSSDAAGNTETAKQVTVKIDTTAPSGSFTLAAGAATTTSIAVSGDSAVADAHGPLGMRFSTDVGANWSAWSAYAERASLTLPAALGTKTVFAEYRDSAGNVLELADTIELVEADIVAPTTVLTGADAFWHKSAVTLSFFATDNPGGSGVAWTEYRIDSGGWTSGASLTITAPADHSGDGVHAVSYRSTDAAGNTETAKSVTVLIDTSGPTTRALVGVSVRRGEVATFSFRVSDATPGGAVLSPTAKVKILIQSSGSTTAARLSLGFRATNRPLSFKWTCGLKKGNYRFFVYATDEAGNTQAKVGSGKLVVR